MLNEQEAMDMLESYMNKNKAEELIESVIKEKGYIDQRSIEAKIKAITSDPQMKNQST